MKTFSFLYPDRRYFDQCLEERGFFKYGFEAFDWDPGWINTVIHARYRTQGYRIYWVHFCQEGNPFAPGLSDRSSHLLLHKHDRIISAGITFEDITQHHRYADPDFILSQISPRPDPLIIGGFHQWDCVDKFASHAHSKDVLVKVDEDLTEHFFSRMQIDSIPLKRTGSALDFLRSSPVLLDHARSFRASRPWFEQI